MSYEKFKEFHEKHPDLDNSEYYKEFPETNTSTIRSWKSLVRKPKELPKTETPLPTREEAAAAQGWDDEMIKLLCTQTKTPLNEFEGVDAKSALIVLKAKLKNQQLQEPDKPSRSVNGPILPHPAPIGQNKKKFGLDEYIKFDDVKNEILMEIPMDVLLDPERNKALGKIN